MMVAAVMLGWLDWRRITSSVVVQVTMMPLHWFMWEWLYRDIVLGWF